MKIFRKNLFFVASTSLSLIMGLMPAAATFQPDNIADCPIGPGDASSVSVTKYLITEQLNVEFNEEAGYCLDKYFSSPDGQSLSYNLTLCDQDWNPVPGWTIDHSWIRKYTKPNYISFVPLSLDNIDIYNFMVTATNGTAQASDKFKINVYKFDTTPPTDYLANWVSYGALALSSIAVIKSFLGERNTILKYARNHPNLFWPLGGTVVGLALGWIGEWINIASQDTLEGRENAFGKAWLLAPTAVGGAVLGGVIAFCVYKRWLHRWFYPQPQSNDNAQVTAAVNGLVAVVVQGVTDEVRQRVAAVSVGQQGNSGTERTPLLSDQDPSQ